MNNFYNTLFSEIAFPWKTQNFYNENITKTQEGDYKLTLVVPGYGKEDITLNVTETNYLEVKLNKNESYTYRYKLLSKVDPTKIIAECKNGILTVTIPKSESTNKSFKIDIQ